MPLDSFDLAPADVKGRFRWAARQGNPYWLWPDVSVADWVCALERITQVTGEVLIAGRARSALDGDPAALGIAGFTSGMGPLLGYWLETGQLAAERPIAAVFELHLAHNRMRMRKLASQAIQISQALAQRGIEHAFLKGMHTAFSYFPEPGTRPMSDIDLLVAARDRPAADQVLDAAGFVPGAAYTLPTERVWTLRDLAREPRSLCFTHADDPWAIDLHVSLDRRYSPAAPIARLDRAASGVDRLRSSLAQTANVLAQPALLLNMAVHTGYAPANLMLVRLVELVLIIRSDSNGGFWDAFMDAAERAEALGYVYSALRFCEELVPGTVPPAVIGRARGSVPPRVLKVIDRLSPANAQCLLRCSLEERLMWNSSRWGTVRHLARELFPPGSASVPRLIGLYRNRFWRVVRRTVSA